MLLEVYVLGYFGYLKGVAVILSWKIEKQCALHPQHSSHPRHPQYLANLIAIHHTNGVGSRRDFNRHKEAVSEGGLPSDPPLKVTRFLWINWTLPLNTKIDPKS